MLEPQGFEPWLGGDNPAAILALKRWLMGVGYYGCSYYNINVVPGRLSLSACAAPTIAGSYGIDEPERVLEERGCASRLNIARRCLPSRQLGLG